MQHVLARSQLRIQLDRGVIPEVGLDENDVRAASGADALQLADQRGRDSFAPVRFGDREIVDVDLGALLLELAQLVRRESSDDLSSDERHEREEGVVAEQSREVAGARSSCAVCVRLSERFSEDREQVLQERDVVGVQELDRETRTLSHDVAGILYRGRVESEKPKK